MIILRENYKENSNKNNKYFLLKNVILLYQDANVVNEIEVGQGTVNMGTIEICLIIIATLSVFDFALRLYSLHNTNLKKIYMSRENNMDRWINGI